MAVTRGGARRRWILPHEAAVCCPGGRWGRRRTRTGECWATLRAEEWHTALLHDVNKVGPGARGTATCTIGDRTVTAAWEMRQNAIWRHGRTFLICPRCAGRCTRLYLPLPDSWLACRRCWGLTYASRTLQNYKDSLWGRGVFARIFGTSQRDRALSTSAERREERREGSRKRWAARRRYMVLRDNV